MPLLQRVTGIISTNLNELVDRWEDPERMLRQSIRDMEDALRSALEGAVTAVANEKLLTRQLTERRQERDRWQSDARKAVQAGADDSARRAITRRIAVDDAIESTERLLSSAGELSHSLRGRIEAMQARLSASKQTLCELSARKTIADAQKSMGLTASVSFGPVFARVDHWIDRLERAEAEAEAWCDLLSLHGEPAAGDQKPDRVGQELAAMKQSQDK